MLTSFLQIAASNAVMGLVLAVIVTAICRIAARPALSRALWVIVLLKLLTPPLWTMPLDGFVAQFKNAPPAARSAGSAESVSLDTARIDATAPPENMQQDGAIAMSPAADTGPKIPAPNDAVAASAASQREFPIRELIAAAWAAGCAVCLVVLVVRVRRFWKSLALTVLAPREVQVRCGALAGQIGLGRAPQVRFANAAIGPSLWAFSRPALILAPESLWQRLDAAQQDALLVHELAHLRRRDHWVRLLEVAATLICWWHPVVWYARRRLHEAEEQCCDAWVLASLPAVADGYAAALVEAVDFLSTAHSATPVLASGLGEFSHLKRRIVMIKNGCVSKTLSRMGVIAVFGLAGVVLPLAPSFGQSADDQGNKSSIEKVLSAASDEGDKQAQAEKERAEAARLEAQQAGRLDAERAIKQAHLEVEQLQAEMAKIHAALEQATARLHSLEAARAAAGEPGYRKSVTDKNRDLQRIQYYHAITSAQAEAQARGSDQRLDRLERQVQEIMVELKRMRTEQHGQPGEKQGM